ncbi:MAG: serine/threonine-protein kinase [Myxococcota bacterium]
MARPLPPPLAEGTLLKDYRLARRLGTGAMGEVYEAVHTVIGRRVAIKVLRVGVDEALNASRRLLEEARAVNAIRHPGIVDVFDVGVYGDRRPYLVMELLEGRTLGERLKAEGPPPPRESLGILEGVLGVLAAAHKAGVIHRDLKPSNVFLLKGKDGSAAVKLLDFGVARREGREEPLTAPSMAVGSVGFMAPEQLQGQAVPSSDLYAVGCLAFQLLAGRPVFPLKNIPEAARRHLVEPAPKLRTVRPDVSPLLEAWVDMLLQKDVDARPRSADAALNALRAVQHELGETKTEPSLSKDPALMSAIRAHKKTELVPAFEPPSGAKGVAATDPVRPVVPSKQAGPVPRAPLGDERPTVLQPPEDDEDTADGHKTLLDS